MEWGYSWELEYLLWHKIQVMKSSSVLLYILYCTVQYNFSPYRKLKTQRKVFSSKMLTIMW